MKIFYHFLMTMCLLGSISLASCNDDDNINTEETEGIHPDVDDVEYTVIDSTTMTAAQVADLVYGSEGSNADEETQEARTKFLAKAQDIADSYASQTGQNGCVTSFHWVNYKYWSTDQFGNRIKLSAKVIWARIGFVVFGLNLAKDLDPDNIYLVEHYNFTDKKNAPSKTFCMDEQLFYDNLVIMPDYIGYGETADKVHPFMNYEVNAKNSYDALEAGYKVYKDSKDSGTDLEKDAKMYIIGGGVGAAYGLAVQKYMETNGLDEKWKFNYSYLCTGPYSAPLTVHNWFSEGKVEYLAYIPMLIKGLFASYPDIMGKSGVTEDSYYSSGYQEIEEQIDNILKEGNISLDDFNKKVHELLHIEATTHPSINLVLDNFYSASARMWNLEACLAKNDLTTGWTPKHTIKLYQEIYSELIPHSNATELQKAFGDKVSLFTSYAAGYWITLEKWRFTLFWGNW